MDFLWCVLGYLLGSLPAGFFIVKFWLNEDIRESGSQTTGATNVARKLGKKGFIITFLIDFLKSLAYVLILKYLELPEWVLLFSAWALIVGHVFPIFLKFTGGKGVAVTMGVLMALNYIYIIILTLLFLLFYLIIKKFAISGLIAFLLLPFFILLFVTLGKGEAFFFLLTNLILIFAHRQNIKDFSKLNKQ